mgnify:CR=1 FL=1
MHWASHKRIALNLSYREDELKLLVQLPLVMIATKLIWNTLTRKEKNERLTEMRVAIIMVENPLISRGIEIILCT